MYISYHLVVDIDDKKYSSDDDDRLYEIIKGALRGTDFTPTGFFNLSITDSHDRPDSGIRRTLDAQGEGVQPI